MKVLRVFYVGLHLLSFCALDLAINCRCMHVHAYVHCELRWICVLRYPKDPYPHASSLVSVSSTTNCSIEAGLG